MKFSKIKAMADAQVKRANAILENARNEDVDDWFDRMDEWCEEYESGAYDETDDIYYRDVLRLMYHKMIDKLETVGDLMYDEWENEYSQCH